MTEAELLHAAGVALYPERSWKADLGFALDVGSRRVRYWANGQEPIPPGVWSDIHTLLIRKERVVTAASNEVAKLIIERATG